MGVRDFINTHQNQQQCTNLIAFAALFDEAFDDETFCEMPNFDPSSPPPALEVSALFDLDDIFLITTKRNTSLQSKQKQLLIEIVKQMDHGRLQNMKVSDKKGPKMLFFDAYFFLSFPSFPTLCQQKHW